MVRLSLTGAPASSAHATGWCWRRSPYDPERPARPLGLVDFTPYPHLDHKDMPDTSLANIEKWASGIPVPTYAIDDDMTIKVTDGTAEVVSEGHWRLFPPSQER